MRKGRVTRLISIASYQKRGRKGRGGKEKRVMFLESPTNQVRRVKKGKKKEGKSGGQCAR